jgi:hypothetical protein
MPATMAELPIRVRVGDMPEEEIGTITLEPGDNVYEVVAEALQRAAHVVRERASIGR